jgi:phage recombination protein Bet
MSEGETALTIVDENGAAIAERPPAQLSPDKIELIRQTICPKATDTELELLLHRCRVTRLDPLSGQIYAFKSRGKLKIGTGIDGFRLVAERTGLRDGDDPPMWSDGSVDEHGKTKWLEVWPHRDKSPHCCRYAVHKKGIGHSYPAVCYFDFYAARDSETGELKFMWQGIGGAQMLAKCAEAAALRKAYPHELGGMYVPEEMEQAARDPEPPAPAPGNGGGASNRPESSSGFVAALRDCETPAEVDRVWAEECRARKGKMTPAEAEARRRRLAELDGAGAA